MSKPDCQLEYLKGLDQDINNSQLLQAELVYLFFAGESCPINYNTAKDYWHVYDLFWHTMGNTFTKVELYFQTDLLQALRAVKQKAIQENVFPPSSPDDDSEHPRLNFVSKMVATLECKESVEKLMKECAIFFSEEQMYDTQSRLFQLSNCVLDLNKNVFRKGQPSDLTSRRSPVVIPEEWLKDPSKMEKASESVRQKAWDILWSIFGRDAEQHELDHADKLGDQDATNFHFFLHLQARLLEGKPLAKCILLHSPRGRNSKGLIQQILQSVWGDYLVPVKATVFHADNRNENEHSAAEITRVGARIGIGNETSKTPWSNGVFKNKNSNDVIQARECGTSQVFRI